MRFSHAFGRVWPEFWLKLCQIQPFSAKQPFSDIVSEMARFGLKWLNLAECAELLVAQEGDEFG